MSFKPNTVEELQKHVAGLNQSGEKVGAIDLTSLNRVLEHTPEDMTVTVQGGATLAELQAHVRQRGQWLPFDPPSDKLTIAELLNADVSGPRRFGYGTVRDYVIGLTALLADGRVAKSGGKVVKNVAGFDVQKLFIGGQGTLGIIVEVNFKLRPIPDREQFVCKKFGSLTEAKAAIAAVFASPLTPTVFDLCSPATVVLGFDGTNEDMEWQLAQAKALGFSEAGNLNYDTEFWSAKKSVQKFSVLPSRLVETIEQLGKVPFIARAGNGVIYHQGETKSPKPALPVHLLKRVKDVYDPKHIFPEILI